MAEAEQVRFRRSPHFPGIELACARYRRRSFPRHFHEEYVIGAMTLGAERLSIRGAERVIRQGEMILIEPGEAHANRFVDDNDFAYAVMYLPAATMAALVDEAFGRVGGLARFDAPHMRSGPLARAFLQAHRLMLAGEAQLEEESALLRFLSLLFGGTLPSGSSGDPGEPERVRRARDYIDAHFTDAISLRRLAEVAGSSPFHLLRSFGAYVGLPPGAYQTQLRIEAAKRLLKSGAGIAETAADLGFADQSHLTRHFQRYVGTSPGRYRAQ